MNIETLMQYMSYILAGIGSAGFLGQRDRAGNQGDAGTEKSADECCGTDHITDPDTGSSNRLVHLLSDSN